MSPSALQSILPWAKGQNQGQEEVKEKGAKFEGNING